MMSVEEAVRALGKSIQADPRYVRYEQAKKANDADAALQEQIHAFQLKRMNYQRLSEQENPDAEAQEKLTALETVLNAEYDAILEHAGMQEFRAAKAELDAMMQKVDSIITLCLNGENPETCCTEQGNCSGNCAACGGGCH